jgi:hypothetical protein
MTQGELYQALLTLALPVAYHSFPAGDPAHPPPSPPYIVYLYAYSSDIMADNRNYAGRGNWQIELYTKSKDPASEKKVQDLLKSLRLPYRKTETYLESEKLRQVIYEVQLIGE